MQLARSGDQHAIYLGGSNLVPSMETQMIGSPIYDSQNQNVVLVVGGLSSYVKTWIQRVM